MLDREPQERLGALLVIGFGPDVVVGVAALGCMQLLHPVPDAAGDQPPQFRPALLDEDPHRIPQRVQALAVREPIELRALGSTQLLARPPAPVQLLERPAIDLLRILLLGLVVQDLPHQLDRVELPAGREHVPSELHGPGRVGGSVKRLVEQVGRPGRGPRRRRRRSRPRASAQSRSRARAAAPPPPRPVPAPRTHRASTGPRGQTARADPRTPRPPALRPAPAACPARAPPRSAAGPRRTRAPPPAPARSQQTSATARVPAGPDAPRLAAYAAVRLRLDFATPVLVLADNAQAYAAPATGAMHDQIDRLGSYQ